NVSVVRFATKVINANGNIISQKFFHPEYEVPSDFLIRKLKGDSRSSLSEYIFKTEKIYDIGFKDFPLAWYSDLLAVLEFSYPDDIYTINDGVVFFRLSEINITGRKD